MISHYCYQSKSITNSTCETYPTRTDDGPKSREKNQSRSQPPSLLYVGRLGSGGPSLVGRIGSEVQVSASLKKNIPSGFCPMVAKWG